MRNRALIFSKAKKIKLIASDVDGVLTHSEIIVLDSGAEVKIWNVKDGFGYDLLRKTFPEIKTAWITGRKSKQVERRAKELKIDFLFQGVKDKLSVLLDLLKKTECEISEVSYIGDDLPDLPVLEKVGFSICPKDAVECVKRKVDMISDFEGGRGVVREVIDIIIESKTAVKKSFGKMK
ncbi:MAG: HAD hydrolase family protein [Elusimicrobiota bacterium]|jgi:3-deoxy-D-manno-octulosonate 8-phosphate phosphatase (KDO 8-P phosphatase)|nr:HAD hydrolase family protein [Elusimicrobiota bacterium]